MRTARRAARDDATIAFRSLLPPTSVRLPGRLRPVLVGLAVVLALASCSKSEGTTPEETGVRTRAIEELRDYGLTAKQAACVADKIGAQSVVEATDLTALTEGQPYKDAADVCLS